MLAAMVVAGALVAAPAGASTNARFGIQDDAWLLEGPGTVAQRVQTLRALGVGIVRFTLRWDQVAPTKPATPRNPADPAYHWTRFDAVLDALHTAGIPALVTIYGAPSWSNGGHGANWLPLSTAIGDFAYAASKHYPWVHLWTAWNEPDTRIFSVPVSPSLYVQHVLNPLYAGLHRANGANLVAGGVTGPRQPPSGMSPIAYMQGMHAAHAHLDAYAQNPYPVTAGETPFKTSCPTCDTLTMAVLGTIRADVTKYFGNKQVWLTEYGYQTNPPDPILGVSLANQAAFIGQAALRVWQQPGVTVLIQFMLRDEPSIGGWQSGLETAAGALKPSWNAFRLPLAEMSRSGSQVTLWGQVRPGSAGREYQLQVSKGGRWVVLGGTAHAATFRRVVTLAPGAKVRLYAPRLREASPTLTIS